VAGAVREASVFATQRFGLYRWHIKGPVRFDKDLKVTTQDLSWRSEGRYFPLQDDISTVSYWCQTEPHAPFPVLPSKDEHENGRRCCITSFMPGFMIT
jgi:hypothetical protein